MLYDSHQPIISYIYTESDLIQLYAMIEKFLDDPYDIGNNVMLDHTLRSHNNSPIVFLYNILSPSEDQSIAAYAYIDNILALANQHAFDVGE